MNGNDQAPATKADIEQLGRLIERVETNLLTEFHKWAQTYEVRARGTSAAVRTSTNASVCSKNEIAASSVGGCA